MKHFPEKKYTEKQKTDVIEAIKSGMSDSEAATFAGVPEWMVYPWKKKAGLVKYSHAHMPEFRNEVMADVKAGMKVTDAAKKYHVDVTTIYGWRKQEQSVAQDSKMGTQVKTIVPPTAPYPALTLGTIDAIRNAVRREAESFRIHMNQEAMELIRKEVATVVAATPIKLSTEDFMQMLRNLVSENTQTKEELARLRKSNSDWQIRAGRALEQAQQAINSAN